MEAGSEDTTTNSQTSSSKEGVAAALAEDSGWEALLKGPGVDTEKKALSF